MFSSCLNRGISNFMQTWFLISYFATISRFACFVQPMVGNTLLFRCRVKIEDSIYYYIYTGCQKSIHRVQRFFSKMKLVETLLRTQLKQTHLENRLHISTETPSFRGWIKTMWSEYANRLKLIPVLFQYYYTTSYLLEGFFS